MDDHGARPAVPRPRDEPPGDRYVLRLFIAGTAPSSALAVRRIGSICRQLLEGRCDLEIIDVHQQPGRAEADDIFAIPTLLKEGPGPRRRIIGDLADEGLVLAALGLQPRGRPVVR
jgi:circadian clock protein KaiB